MSCRRSYAITLPPTYDAQGRRKTWRSGTFTDPSSGATTSTLTHVYVTDADNREVLEYDGITG